MRSFRPSRLLTASVIAAGALGLSGAPALDPIPAKAPAPVAAPVKDAGPADEKAVRALLKEKPKFAVDGEALVVKEVLQLLAKEHGLTVRIDLAGFKRFRSFEGGPGAAAQQADRVFIALRADAIGDINEIFEVKVRLHATGGTTLADLLSDFCAQLPGKCAYRIRHNQVLIGPAFQPPVTPGAGTVPGGAVQMAVSPNLLAEQLLGESVSVAIDDKPLTDALAELRKITGANIVLDARSKDKAKAAVSGTFDDARLLTVLELLADMCELKVVSNNNVFYITGVENAAKMQKQVHRDLFGEPMTAQLPPFGGIVGGGTTPPPATPTPEPKK